MRRFETALERGNDLHPHLRIEMWGTRVWAGAVELRSMPTHSDDETVVMDGAPGAQRFETAWVDIVEVPPIG